MREWLRTTWSPVYWWTLYRETNRPQFTRRIFESDYMSDSTIRPNVNFLLSLFQRRVVEPEALCHEDVGILVFVGKGLPCSGCVIHGMSHLIQKKNYFNVFLKSPKIWCPQQTNIICFLIYSSEAHLSLLSHNHNNNNNSNRGSNKVELNIVMSRKCGLTQV